MEEAPAEGAPPETPPTPAAAPAPPAESEPPAPPPPAPEPIPEAANKKEIQEKEGESPAHDDRPAIQTTREPSIERSKLPTNKAIDFQVRVRVVEGRNISGSNISPVVKVTVSNQVRQTRVKKSTNKPFFDEIFFFNFKIIASELFDQTITFEIFNSRKLRSNAMIGTFSSDVGFFYDQKDHSVIRRWLLLTDPEDIMAGAKGYLKVTVMVLGPGDEAPEVSESAGKDDEDDLEENLLQPAGVMLRPAAFSLKVYKLEDIPQMDSAFSESLKKVFNVGEKAKALVDPYFMMTFAGKQSKTKYINNDDNPELNQELSVKFQMPSMCEKIKLQIWDWDKIGSDDLVGTSYIPLSAISGQGDKELGYLPLFGPSFVNFYGSTREYSTLPDECETLNEGIGEGVAYRGRALVELETKVTGEMETGVEDIDDDDVVLIQSCLRRRKFKLFGCFLEATMIACKDIPIQFEISIGNYGNRLDSSVEPSSSSTPCSNAVFDGCYYYYLPWGSQKPCCSVDSHWEDMLFRVYSMNMLLDICERIEEKVDGINIGMNENLSKPEIASLIMGLLQELIEACSQIRTELPEIKKGPGITQLDFKKREVRIIELTAIEKEASHLRESATDIDEAMHEIEHFLQRLRALAVEPQNNIPDVIIWMLSGTKRIAYHRIPANEILFSHKEKMRGKNCARMQNIFMKYPGDKQFDFEDHPEVPCQISVIMWFGLENDQEAWTDRGGMEGEFGVFAETYENQMKFLGKWTTKGLMRPSWSDAEGTVKLLKENFVAPRGWRWEGDWLVSPETSTAYDSDTGHKTFLDDVYECESRLPGDNWGAAKDVWTDIYGNKCEPPSTIECPEGWSWTMEWTVDLNRAVDENGWEYSVDDTSGSYIAVEKMYHLYRRRRIVRSRTLKLTSQVSTETEEMADMLVEGGWEYAITFTSQFHSKERTADMVRRRRWHRRIIQDDPRAPAIFRQTGIAASDDQKKKKAKADSADVPRMIMTYQAEPHKYQLRVYLFQGRDLLPADADGLSDPYARVVFQNQSQVTRCIHRTLCPTWDQTLVFDNVNIYGSTEIIEQNSPQVVIELFDQDEVGKDEYMGRCIAHPIVKLNGAGPPAPRLLWVQVFKGKSEAGEILAAFELFLDEGADLPFMPPMNESYFIVPSGIRPVQQRTAIEVLCWGVRNMKKYQLANVTSPSVEFECGGHVIQSEVIKNTLKTPNFENPLFFFDVMLPKEELYIPPMNIKVRDNRSFGRCPIVGVHCLKSLQPYRYDTPKDDAIEGEDAVDASAQESAYDLSVKEDKKKSKQLTFDWWSKYYASIGSHDKAEGYIEDGNDTVIVYSTELERVEHFKRFQDFIVTFPLYRGKVKDDDDLNDVGEFKGTFRVYPLPNDPGCAPPPKMIHSLPQSQPVECVIRLYVIKAIDLQPMDPNGLADPYVVIRLGKKKIKDQDNYIPNTLNPIFGKMFEMTALIPIAKDLEISIVDYDLIGSDEEIGKTTIDLENRFLTRFRATCGLPQSYYTSGVNNWRDSQTPKQILEKYCQVNGFPPPKFRGNSRLVVNGKLHSLEDFEEGNSINQNLGPTDERLALHVLNCQPLVPEHIETRPLYSSLQPDIEQGKVQLWVDIFPKELGPPGPPFDVSPRIPQEYELRVIIWNTSDVILEDTNIMGEAMSDIYVKGWIAGIDDSQKTDVHFRSLDGTGNFNWRFVFPFLFVPAEKVMVVRKKRHLWSLDMTESRMPPRLVLQIWDNDIFSPDDFLGTLELVLTHMPRPTKSAKKCTLKAMNMDGGKSGKPRETVSLFDMKRVYGWWPCVGEGEEDQLEITGKLEMTLEVLPNNEVTEKPAGKGRSDPNLNPTLDPPNRPATSFSWFSSPFKSLRYIIWRRYKWYFIGFVVSVCLLALVVLFFYSMPGYTVKKIFNV